MDNDTVYAENVNLGLSKKKWRIAILDDTEDDRASSNWQYFSFLIERCLRSSHSLKTLVFPRHVDLCRSRFTTVRERETPVTYYDFCPDRRKSGQFFVHLTFV